MDKKYRNYIGGEWADNEGGTLDVLNPATDKRIASVPDSKAADVDRAVAAAKAAQPAWERLPAIQRANHLRTISAKIRQNAERLARLTADLLTLSRVELGQQEFKFASYYANRLLTDNLDGMRPIAARRGIQLVLDPVQPESAEVFCDAEAVHQILTNLLDNAIKYTPDGGTVIVGAKQLDAASDASGRVEFFVRDAGPGIPADDLPRLFERFYRVDKARSRALGGTGLGLAIVKHLARSQNGEVRVESQVDKGSTFFFALPVQDPGLPNASVIQKELTTS